MAFHAHRRAAARALIDRALQGALDRVAGGAREAFLRLVVHAQRVSTLLRMPARSGRLVFEDPCSIVDALRALACYHHEWLRPVEDWAPDDAPPYPQLSTLAHHLLAHYPVPAFMLSAWFEGSIVSALRHQGWFVHLGSGGNIRTTDIPLQFTRAMAHQFGLAPAHLSISNALRWAQVIGMGGSKELALAVLRTRLGWSFEQDPFWRTVIQFFVNQQSLEMRHVFPIVDFLEWHKFQPEETIVDGRLQHGGPPRPDLSMKGRTLSSLRRDVDAWHGRLNFEATRPVLRWRRSNLRGFRLVLGNEESRDFQAWTITQLLNSHELRAEGRAMHHCVAIYDRRCARGDTSIWSLRLRTETEKRRRVTLEVDEKDRSICQASRFANNCPSAQDWQIIRQWARQEDLKIDC